MKVNKYYEVIPSIEIGDLTPDEASRIELALCKLDAIKMRAGTDNWMSHYAHTSRFTDESYVVIRINEAKSMSMKHRSVADSYIHLREWEKELDKISNELIDTISKEREEES